MLKNGRSLYTNTQVCVYICVYVCVGTGGFGKWFGQCASAIRIGGLHQDILFGRKWRSRRLNVRADGGDSGLDRGRM